MMTCIYAAFAIVPLLIWVESLWPARTEQTQNGLNLLLWAVRLPLQLIVLPAIGAALAEAGRRAGVPSLRVSTWPFALGAAAYLLVHDLGEYAFHRAQHAVPSLWRLHSLHHSDRCMSATTTERHFWGDHFLKAATIWPAAALIMQPSGGQYYVFAVAYLYNYFIHANIPVSFGSLGWMLNSPAYHRLHHSAEPEDFDRNFVALFPLWDLMFGTYRRPRGFARTGLDIYPQTATDALLWPFLPISAPVPIAAVVAGGDESPGEPTAA